MKLSELKVGDVAIFTGNPDGGQFVVTSVLADCNLTWIQRAYDEKPYPRYSDQYTVQRLGTGRVIPPRIEMLTAE